MIINAKLHYTNLNLAQFGRFEREISLSPLSCFSAEERPQFSIDTKHKAQNSGH